MQSSFEMLHLPSITTLDSGPGDSSFAAAPSLAPSVLAPALLSSFVGLVDSNTSIPPDTMGAAGPNHLVSFLNSEVGFFSKSGTKLNSRTTLTGFWSSLVSTNNLPNFAFDPKVIYDQGIGRFIAVTLDGSLPADNSSWVLLAVSRSSDPTAGWNLWAIPADPTNVTWADFPGIGIDDNNVTISANIFNSGGSFQHAKIWSIPKTQLLLSPQTPSLTRTEFTTSSDTVQPAHSFGATTTEYFVTEGNISNVGGITSFIDLHVFAVTGSPPALVSIGSVPITPYPLLFGLPVAPNDNVDTGDTRILNVVYRNGHLYATHTVSNTAKTKTEVAWYEIAPSSPPALVQEGRVSDLARFYYYPSIAVNGNGDIAIGFSGSSPTEFPGAYFTARQSADPPGFTQTVGLLKAGEASYFKTFGTASDPNRWGDFSATVVDPTDDFTFWTIQEYARPSSGTFPNTGRWGTWWGNFSLPLPSAPAPPTGLSATALSDAAIQLSWTDASLNESVFRIERKTGTGGTFTEIDNVPANTTNYVNTGLTEGTTYFYRVRSSNAGGDSAYSNIDNAVTFPAAPSGLSAVSVSASQIDLSWTNQSASATDVFIERKTGAGGTYAPLITLTLPATSYSDNSAASDTTSFYRIRAHRSSAPIASAFSAYSNEASATTGGTPAPPGGGGGGGCSIAASSSAPELPAATKAASFVLLLFPACALGLRRIFHRRKGTVPIRHPLCY